MKLSTRAAAVAATAFCATAAAAPAASAASAPACPQLPLSQAFAAWGDKSLYTPAPDGGFEAGASGWALAGGAVVGDDGPLTGGRRALELRQGASATTAAFCATMGFPYSRMFARGGGTVRVEVLRVSYYGTVLTATPAGDVSTGATWGPTRRFAMAQGQVNRFGSAVKLRFTATRGTVRIDDVLVDPRLSR